MVGPSKILTVSYGTFSCTLEGFDNPFSTMRGIAEYFRDLAADDRYFGAEPPIPDAEMLHRIAESDAQKRVVAQVEDNGVTLRQVETDENTDTASMVASGVAASSDVVANDPFVDEPADIVALNEPLQVETESVAAKLARIRAVVSHNNEATEEDSEVEDFTTSPISAAFDDVELDEIEPENDQEEIAAESSVETDAPAEEPEEVEVESETAVHVEPEAEDQTEVEPVEEAQVEALDATDDTAETSAEMPDADDDDVTDIVSETVSAPEEPEVEPVPEVEMDKPAEAIDMPDDAEVAEFMGEPAEEPIDAGTDDTDELAPEDFDSAAVTRIVKMRRSDFDAAQEYEPTQDSEINTESSEEPISSLSAEDEAELMANLEQVQRKADAEERAEKEGRALLENQDIEASAESVSRILDVTNTELEETEGTRRRSAIAHLKAAVAATRADKFLSRKRKNDEEEELSQYRDDLAQVVKPRRPANEGAKTARQAPLMLVSEQRVDEPVAEVASDGSSVLPRRLSAGNLALSEDDLAAEDANAGENMFVQSDGFAEFAQEMGANDLPDLLEAAAAYSAFVEGQSHFSRPQIMQAVASVREEEFTREEGLRSFGLLLRRGKIKKLKRGQFAVAETTRFNPQPRAVGE